MNNKKQLELLIAENKSILSKEAIDYLESLLNLEISVLNNKYISYEELNKIQYLELFTKIADYNFQNRPFKLIRDSLSITKDNQAVALISTNELCGRLPMKKVSLKTVDNQIDLFEIYNDANNCYGQCYLINLHKIISPEEVQDTKLVNNVYKLLIKDFGLKDSDDVNAIQQKYHRYSMNTSIYNKPNKKVKTKTK